MNILGISAFYHDSAASLIRDGEIIAAVQEERFTRKKHDHRFPLNAVEYCLRAGEISAEDIDYVVFYEKPLLKFERLLETYIGYAPRGFRQFLMSIPLWLRQKLHLPREMDKALGNKYTGRYVFTEHHESHAASAFFPSPFEQAAILTLDGVGEWTTAAFGIGKGNKIELTNILMFPHSLGLLYSAFTYYTGFRVNSGEYKLMGLAPYGEPKYYDLIMDKLIDLKEDGSFRLDLSYFSYCHSTIMISPKFEKLFGGPARKPEAALTQNQMDIAASIQAVTEEIVLRMARHMHRQTKMKNLVLAGGVALNCVCNGRILRETDFDNVWIQPAAGDAGGSLGAALLVWYQLLNNERKADGVDKQRGSLLGPAYSNGQIKQFLDSAGAKYHTFENDEQLFDKVADLVSRGKVIGWFQGRMEFGPRALGNRSIIGDARSEQMQSLMNRKIKFRESFRPFAPCVLREDVHEYFQMRPNEDSPYMLLVAPVKKDKQLTGNNENPKGLDKLKVKRSVVPAITHVDYSARVQTVDPQRHPKLHRLMSSFKDKTGCAVIINTSFNIRGEPIVCSPEHAYRCFMATDMDYVVMGRHLLDKKKQSKLYDDLDILMCPACGGDLKTAGDAIKCTQCPNSYRIEDGIPLLFWPNEWDSSKKDVTDIVKSFYEKTPFPNYEDTEDVGSLVQKARKGIFARLLNEQIPFNAKVLEVGCGTGQLSNFLGVSQRFVYGTDICLNSLKLGQQFKENNNIERVRLYQMNLFRPIFKEESFSVVICNGVLHHTGDPFAGFRSISRLVKKGGYILIGLYNKYGRITTDIRRVIFRITNNAFKFLDPRLRDKSIGDVRKLTWFLDQYKNPHESKHTIGEVLKWFDQTGFEFVNSIPKAQLSEKFSEKENLFESSPRGNWFDHFIAQSHLISTGNKEGGFFLMIGRKKL